MERSFPMEGEARGLETLTTEKRNSSTLELDTMSPLEILRVMNQEDEKIPGAIAPHLEELSRVVEWGVLSLKEGGRLVYMGAGTSGRLGILDASECPPTFGVSPSQVVGLMAGGERAITRAVEGAEDRLDLGEEDLKGIGLTRQDLVIGLSASGRTPYVLGGLLYAGRLGCKTVAISCNENSCLGREASLGIDISLGPEVLTGSTRLKAGTAQKMVLNMISTAVMVRLGKVYQNLMVDVMATNEKLRRRSLRIVQEATGIGEDQAREVLLEAGGSCKLAITKVLLGCDMEKAREALLKSGGHVREAVLGE